MAKAASSSRRITQVKVKMYCLGTGDCFVYKFFSGATERFTMMIDCGSCRGEKKDFEPYLQVLAADVKNKIDLLVITHEHNDHVNGFAKCPDIFKAMTIKKAWFAWTEDPDDPGNRAKDLQEKKKKMKNAFANAFTSLKNKSGEIEKNLAGDRNKQRALNSHEAFIHGLDTLADINLGVAGKPLPGMSKIKSILEEMGTTIEYLEPGTTKTISSLPGLKFHILGPPFDSESVYKHEKEGTDVFSKNKKFGFSMGDFSMAVNAFSSIGTEASDKDIPFHDRYLLPKENNKKRAASIVTTIIRQNINYGEEKTKAEAPAPDQNSATKNLYFNKEEAWRKIDLDWLNSAGSLALRLNSHINNTSLVMAIESEGPGNKVMLLPGDAEFGSWQSWHAIKKWEKKGKDGKHFVEDLLNRTVFYKVSHHLSYNGTALEKGINMMNSDDLVAMATLDRERIAEKWKTTMPNKKLLAELVTRCKGKVFVMNETKETNAPGKVLPRKSLPKTEFEQLDFDPKKHPGKKGPIYLQYNVKL